jgi:hypothetical protein
VGYGESPPVVVGEPQSPETDLPSEETILFNQVRERLPLQVIEPAGDARSNNRRTDTSITRATLYHTPEETVAGRRILRWDTTSFFS